MIRKLLHKMKKPDGKRRFRFRFGVWLILLLAWSAGKSYGQDRRLQQEQYYTVTNNEREGYVYFKIPIVDDDGDNEWVTGDKSGKLKVIIDGEETTILSYNSESDGRDMPTAQAWMTLEKGHAIFKTRDGDKEHSTGSYNYWFNREGNYVTYMIFDWYYPSEFEGKDMRFHVTADVATTGDGSDNDYKVDLDLAKGQSLKARSFSKPLLTDPILSTNEVGMYQLDYTTTDVPKKIHNNIDDKWINTEEKSRTLYAEIKDTKRDYTLTVVYQLNRFYESKKYTATKELLAFHQAKNFTAQNADNGNTLLTWTIANTETKSQQGDQFEIQRATNSNFDGATTIGTVPFSLSFTSFSYEDKTGEQNANGELHYRIRRTKQLAWEWNLVQTDDIEKNISHRKVVSASVERHDWESDHQKAKISWELDEVTQTTVWTTGAKVVIKRYTNRGNGSTFDKEFIVGDDEYFIDQELYEPCVDYTYAVYVKPGNENHKTQAEVAATVRGEAILPTVAGKIESLTVSKGYYPNYTSL